MYHYICVLLNLLLQLSYPAFADPYQRQLVFHNDSSFDNGVTNLHGIPLPSLKASQAIGTRGHILLQDFFLIEKLASFNRERIPERVVHAKGAGALGYFQVTHDISFYTKARFLNGIGKKTPVIARFSTTAGERGTADTAIGPRGFAVKFYTEEGNHDLVGNNLETFPVRDPMLFPDMNHSRKRNPQTNLVNQSTWWDFTSLRPESSLHTLHLFTEIGRLNGYRGMDGFGVHAFKFVNRTGHVCFGKFVWKSLQTGKILTYLEAAQLAGSNPDYNTQDLYDAIAKGDYPSWALYIQVMTIEQARNYRRNPFDITKTWRREEFPYIRVGKMILHKNPSNYFAQIEQVAFAPSNMVPGIEASPDRMLSGRLFAYQDSQRYRLGVNYPLLPVNKPVSRINSYMRDGVGCHGDNGNGEPNYFPNGFGGQDIDSGSTGQVSFYVEGVVDRYDIPVKDEHAEARTFLEQDVSSEDRQRLVTSIAARLRQATKEIQERTLNNIFYPISRKFGNEVKRALDLAI